MQHSNSTRTVILSILKPFPPPVKRPQNILSVSSAIRWLPKSCLLQYKVGDKKRVRLLTPYGSSEVRLQLVRGRAGELRVGVLGGRLVTREVGFEGLRGLEMTTEGTGSPLDFYLHLRYLHAKRVSIFPTESRTQRRGRVRTISSSRPSATPRCIAFFVSSLYRPRTCRKCRDNLLRLELGNVGAKD